MKLNQKQQSAVDTIDGSLIVLAGPGTGKTELLSARVGQILKTTDTPPQAILCLTFTDAGVTAMQSRLIERLGAEGYKVPVFTFHSFAADIMNRYREYFYDGAELAIADDLTRHQILTAILDGLAYDNPLKSTFSGAYTAMSDIKTTISEIKRSGLSIQEITTILDNAQTTIEATEPLLETVFGARVSAKTLATLESVLPEIEGMTEPSVLDLVPSFQSTLVESLQQLVAEATNHDRLTPPLSEWKKTWLEKDSAGNHVLKARRRIEKLRALLPVMEQYNAAMARKSLQDYDDLILTLIRTLESQPELRYDLQERYLYFMVDEFQDTNLAQMRIIDNLTNSPVHEGDPNLMVVGDDDQAIYSFQGAEVGNIMTFHEKYPNAAQVVLTDNYRSPEKVLRSAEKVIEQGSERLVAHLPGLSKQLTAHATPAQPLAQVHQFAEQSEEYHYVAAQIAKLIASGAQPHDIAVIGMRHADLELLLPYLQHHELPLSYERRENVLQNKAVQQLILLLRIIRALQQNRPDIASTFLPELLANPAWGVTPHTLWWLGLDSYKSKKFWVELLPDYEETSAFAKWLIETAVEAQTLPLELLLDRLIGHDQPAGEYTSPLKAHFFSHTAETDYRYINHLDSLIAIREAVRNHYPAEESLTLEHFIDFIDLAEQTETRITRVRRTGSEHGVQLMSAHGAKGLEFNHVFIINAVDSRWGEKARGRTASIGYPENLRIRAQANTLSDRLRLFFVAMTRAKQQLFISYAQQSDAGKPQLLTSFLSGNPMLDVIDHTEDLPSSEAALEQAEAKWYQPLVEVEPHTLQAALAARLERYKLSATDLNAYLDVSKGGPQAFLINNLLRFPSAMSPNAAYGSAIHATLQRAHTHIQSKQQPLLVDELLDYFEAQLATYPLKDTDRTRFAQQGRDSLAIFFEQHYHTFNANQRAEIAFSAQNVSLQNARLTGNIDVMTIVESEKTLDIIDYKTGKAFTEWGKGDPFTKMKSHHYQQQLLFYHLLVKHSRDYQHYTVTGCAVQFVEPDKTRDDAIHRVDVTATPEDLERLTTLSEAVWQRIMAADFPDTSAYTPDLKGIKAFEDFLLDSTERT